MRTLLLILLLPLLTNYTKAQTTVIPDANFEAALITLGHDTGIPDGVIPTANINSLIVLDVSSKNISDLTGIEDFTALVELGCSGNQLTSLNITQNLNLAYLYCDYNNLTNLDVTQNTTLKWLFCDYNYLTDIDIGQNTFLEWFKCGINNLTSLDVTQIQH